METEAPSGGWICEVHLLQSPITIVRGGRRIEGGWRLKSLELLAFLAVHPGGASKDQIQEALWPDEDPENTKYMFWHTVSHLRNRLRAPGSAEQVLKRVDDLYRLNLASVWVDVIEFESLVKHGEIADDPLPKLRRVVSLYKEEFCSGRYYAWVTPYAEHFRNVLLRAVNQLAGLLLEGGFVAEALRVVGIGIVVDPYDEGLARQGLQLESMLGRNDLVIRRFKRLRRLLLEDLAIEPSSETVQVVQELTILPSALPAADISSLTHGPIGRGALIYKSHRSHGCERQERVWLPRRSRVSGE